MSADILQIDARFVSLLKCLGENHINVRLSGAVREDGYAVYKIREIAFGGRSEAVCRGRVSAVYDRASPCQRCSVQGDSG